MSNPLFEHQGQQSWWNTFLLFIWLGSSGSLDEDQIIVNISVVIILLAEYDVIRGMVTYTTLFLGYHFLFKPILKPIWMPLMRSDINDVYY